VSNNGGTSGEYEIVLKVNGTLDATRKVTVGASSSSVVTFAVTRSAAGSYAIDVNGSTASFTVVQATPPTTAPPTQAPTPAPTSSSGGTGQTVWLVIGVAIGVGILTALIFLVLQMRRRPQTPSA
jgi:hypothetical protein